MLFIPPYPLSRISRQKKIKHFIENIPKDSYILEIGPGGGGIRDYCLHNNFKNYVSIDLVPPADIVGDIHDWNHLGLQPASFDFIIAFEVVEHVDCFKEIHDLLRPGGKAFLTSPVPHFDWFLKVLEFLRLNQSRTSPHSNLVNLNAVPGFQHKHVKIIGGIAQWAVFTK